MLTSDMHREIFKNWRILSATLFSVVLIVSVYVFAHGLELPKLAQASTETALLQVIATKDSDSDGLSDWEESLYGTDPHNTDTFHLGMTDGAAVARGLIVPKAIVAIPAATSTPGKSGGIDYAAKGLTPPTGGTLTDVFAKNFFSLYITAKQTNGGAVLTSDQTSALAVEAASQLSQEIVPAADFKKAADIKVSGTGADALRAFAVAAEAVLKKNKTAAQMSEIEYFQSAVQDGNTTALAHLASLAEAYRASAVGLAALPVPKELAAIDLVIINSIMRLSEIDNDFARVNIDPLTAMLALNQFRQTELSGEQAFTTLADIYAASGVVLPNGAPGASFVNLIANITAGQQAAAKKL